MMKMIESSSSSYNAFTSSGHNSGNSSSSSISRYPNDYNSYVNHMDVEALHVAADNAKKENVKLLWRVSEMENELYEAKRVFKEDLKAKDDMVNKTKQECEEMKIKYESMFDLLKQTDLSNQKIIEYLKTNWKKQIDEALSVSDTHLLKKELKSVKKESVTLSNQLETRTKELTQSLMKQNSLNIDNNEMKKEIERLKIDLSKEQAANDANNLELMKLRDLIKQLEEQKSSNQALEKYNRDMNEMEIKYNNVNEELERIKLLYHKQSTNMDAVMNQLKEKEEAQFEALQEMNSLKEQISSWIGQVDLLNEENKLYKNQTELAKEETNYLRVENDSLKKEINKNGSLINESEEKIQTLRDQLDTYKNELKGVNLQNQSLKDEIARLTNSQLEKESEVQSLREKSESQRNEIERSNHDTQLLIEKIKDLNQEVDKKDEKINQLENENERLQQDLLAEQMKKVQVETDEKAGDHKTNVDEVADKGIVEMREILETEQTKRNNLELENSRLVDEIVAINEDMQKKDEQLSQMHTKIIDLEHLIQLKDEEIDIANGELKALQDDYQKLREEIEKGEEELIMLKKELDDANQCIHILREKAGRFESLITTMARASTNTHDKSKE